MKNYNYKLTGTSIRKITRKNITDVKRAINNYCNNPIKGRREFNSVVIDFIFITLGFKNINNSIDIKKYKRDTPKSDKKKALRRIIELIDIIIEMISENEDIIKIEKDNGNFIEYLLVKQEECEDKLNKPNKPNKSNNQNSKRKRVYKKYNPVARDSVAYARKILNNKRMSIKQKIGSLKTILFDLNQALQLEMDVNRKAEIEAQINSINSLGQKIFEIGD